MLRRALTLAVPLLLGQGCAAILAGTTAEVPVTSTPSGAEVALDGEVVGTTPTRVTVPKTHAPHIYVGLPGYEVAPCRLRAEVSAQWVILDVVLTGVVGVAVDAVTGAWHELVPAGCHVDLRPKAEPPAPLPGALEGDVPPTL